MEPGVEPARPRGTAGGAPASVRGGGPRTRWCVPHRSRSAGRSGRAGGRPAAIQSVSPESLGMWAKQEPEVPP
ncbi:hypothetical protein GCM10018781_62140 [Kitasatospora indigofera]|uniref:Uncharacterized protein n=1 Tax=Kitasatospora indigofera TaxID=67307 RepID=A0A919GA78_9ACTN|nr:hypothetical protein GCM10018781_62140 [Kitasatospora indigofera]